MNVNSDSNEQTTDGSFIVRDKRWLEAIGWPAKYPGPKLNPANIPPQLHVLIPHAEKWVNEDDIVQATVIKVATNQELEEFLVAVKQIGIAEISRLALMMVSDETQYADGTIFLAMLDAADTAEYELQRRSQDMPHNNKAEPEE